MSQSSSQPSSGAGTKTRTSDIVLDDASLTMAAKGVFVTTGLLGGQCSLAELLARTCDDRDTVIVAVRELVARNYVSLSGERVSINDPSNFGLSS